MPPPSTETSPENHEAADSSPSRGSEGITTIKDPQSVPMCDLQNHRCVLDSVAAEHATGTEELLFGTRAPGGGASFCTRFGKDLRVVSVGSIETPQFAIPDVFLVPELGPGLILVSVRQLACRGLAVTFGNDSCHVKDRTTGDVVGEGRLREEDGLYHLDFLRIPQS